MVEAMACGVPTVASNTSCIPEVSGGSLIYFDPLSVEDIAVAIMRAIGDSKLRDQLRDKGLRRSAEFSWEAAASKTWRVLDAAARQPQPVTTAS